LVPIQLPPRDEHDKVIQHDHAEIAANQGVIRRVSEKQIVTDKSGIRRISTIAFRPSTGQGAGMSVDLEALILEAGIDARKYVTSPIWTGSVRFTAGALRAEGFSVGYDPLPDNPYHGEVWGSFTRAQQRRLQKIAAWFVPIDGVELGSA
jgi:hypothetical protein